MRRRGEQERGDGGGKSRVFHCIGFLGMDQYDARSATIPNAGMSEIVDKKVCPDVIISLTTINRVARAPLGLPIPLVL